MSKRNEAKIDTLECVMDLGDVTSNDLSYIREISLHCASMRLKRAHGQGLLTREKIGKEYTYEINRKGIQRLTFLKNNIRAKEEGNLSEKLMPFFLNLKSSRIGVSKKKVNLFQNTERCKVNKERFGEEHNQTSHNVEDNEIEDIFSNIEKCEVIRERNTQQEDDLEKFFKRISQERCIVLDESK